MDSIYSEVMEKVLKRCDICLQGCLISKELLLTTFYDFISSTIEKEKHNVGIVLHTGSLCFDAVMLTYAAISNILYNRTDAGDVVSSLSPGDTVIYYKDGKDASAPKRYAFLGYVNSPGDKPSADKGTFICLEQEKDKTTYVGSQGWSRILPYFGDSASMDGRGLRRETKNREFFCESVLEMNASEIPRLIDTSTVIVMSREEANFLINNLSYRFDDKEIKFTELVSASYFANGDNEYRYPGNPSKTESVIKITSKVFVARRLLLQRGGNKNIGLIICGYELYRRGESEIPELLERQSIQYIYLCVHIDSEVSANLLEIYENAELFACTKDFLLSHSLPPIEANPVTEQLEDQVNIIIEKEVFEIDVPGFIGWEDYKTFKKCVSFIKKSDYLSEPKDDFIVQAYSLMNLFLTAVFPIERLEEYINDGKIDNVENPVQRIHRLTENMRTFPEYLSDAASQTVRILENACLELWEEAVKETALIRIISENPGLKTAVVVPKAYYAILIEDKVKSSFPDRRNSVTVVTANRFNNVDLYDLIIAVGNISGTRFEALRCRSAKTINVLLYDVEKYQYKKKARNAKKAEHILNCRSTIITDDEYEEEPIGLSEIEIEEVDGIDREIDDFISSVTTYAAINAIRNSTDLSGNKKYTDIAAVAKFATDEMAFFSKNYKAYVLDDAENSVKEVETENLSEGDTVVFTRSTSKTRDIVDSLLQDMIQSRSVSPEVESAYYLSGEWKSSLINYMNQSGRNEKSLAEEMIRNGVGVHEQTIRNWLDEGTHTVRPKKLDSIRQIALLTGDERLFDHAEECFEAGGIIYGIRRQILNAIGQAILGEVTGKTENSSPLLAAVSERIKDAAVVLQIETITFMEDQIPLHMINRPLNIN